MNMVMMELNNFKFNAFYPNASVLNYSVETGGRQMGIFNWMEAQVNGCRNDGGFIVLIFMLTKKQTGIIG